MAITRELKIISSLVQPGASVGAAVQRLLVLSSAAAASTTESTIFAENPFLIHIENTWLALVNEIAATTSPSEHAVLIEFIQLLRQQEVIDPTTGYPLQGDDDLVWRPSMWTGLPLFRITMRDCWDYGTIDLRIYFGCIY